MLAISQNSRSLSYANLEPCSVRTKRSIDEGRFGLGRGGLERLPTTGSERAGIVTIFMYWPCCNLSAPT